MVNAWITVENSVRKEKISFWERFTYPSMHRCTHVPKNVSLSLPVRKKKFCIYYVHKFNKSMQSCLPSICQVSFGPWLWSFLLWIFFWHGYRLSTPLSSTSLMMSATSFLHWKWFQMNVRKGLLKVTGS